MATHMDAQRGEAPAVVTGSDIVVRQGARRWLAAARIGTGFIFLWAFLDKTFGLHYSTGAPTSEADLSSRSRRRSQILRAIQATSSGPSVCVTPR